MRFIREPKLAACHWCCLTELWAAINIRSHFLQWPGSWYIRWYATVYTNVLMHHHGAISNNIFPNLNDFNPGNEVSVIDLQILFGVISCVPGRHLKMVQCGECLPSLVFVRSMLDISLSNITQYCILHDISKAEIMLEFEINNTPCISSSSKIIKSQYIPYSLAIFCGIRSSLIFCTKGLGDIVGLTISPINTHTCSVPSWYS